MSTYWKQKVTPPLFIILFILLVSMIFILRNHANRANVPIWEKSDKNYDNSTIKNEDGSGGDTANNKSISLNKSIHEIVIPIKLVNSHLSEEDKLFISKYQPNEDSSSSAYSLTGNFRRKNSTIWDSHPQYKLNAFGHQLHLILEEYSSFIHNDFNYSDSSNADSSISKCFYNGHIEGDIYSSVAVSLCDGMTGHIKTKFGTLLIEPYTDNTDHIDLDHLKHIITRQNPESDDVAALTEVDLDFSHNDNSNHHQNNHRINKRSLSYEHVFTMEILVVADESMVQYHKEKLNSYILMLMSIVNNIFQDPSIGNSIHISIKKIVPIKDVVRRKGKTLSAAELLREFCRRIRNSDQDFDTAIMLTRNQICRSENEKKCDTLGLAEVGTICKRDSCAVIQDNGLPAGFTIAHELGHVLDMPHDDESKCAIHNTNGENSLNIMASTMGANIHPWSWSKCSRHYVTEFLERADTSCLDNEPESTNNLLSNYPVLRYSLDEQCQLTYGKKATICDMEQTRSYAPCSSLWCKTENPGCVSSNAPWSDGTPCGDNRWCIKGICTLKNGMKPNPVDGGWGPWSSYSGCSLPCGGGVQHSQRECNNPIPQNGGKYCIGNRKKYRSCNTFDCGPEAIDMRQQQCSEFGRSTGMSSSFNQPIVWVPKYGLSDKCKLYCRVTNTTSHFTLQEKVVDGTPCSFFGFDKCVHGICRQAGCDNELNSNAQLDRCGVCEGQNNTCTEITGNFYKSDLSNAKRTSKFFYYVIKIPSGAANILITQPGLTGSNYIVLRNDQGKIILNDASSITTYNHIFFYAGVAFEYSGSGSPIEKVNSTYARKINRDLTVEVLSFTDDNQRNRDDHILINYTYTFDLPENQKNQQRRTLPRPPTTTTTTAITTTTSTTTQPPPSHNWQLDQWSSCNSLCNGRMYRQFSCVDLLRSQKVPEQYCSHITKPKESLVKQCNEFCNITLLLISSSECSASCGRTGTRENTFQCIQTFSNNTRLIIDISYCADIKHQQFEACEGGGCWEYSEWSECNSSCGPGTQTRELKCMKLDQTVDKRYCKLHEAIHYNDLTRSCDGGGCWKYSEWSDCDSVCGPGTQTRELQCIANNLIVDRRHCKAHEEIQFRDVSRSCMNRPCLTTTNSPPGNWVTSEWGPCQDDCTKSRNVQCSRSPFQGNCLNEDKPSKRMKCCHYKNVLNWSECNVPCGEGKRKRYHFCARIEKTQGFKKDKSKKKIPVDSKYCENLPIPRPAKTSKKCNLKHCRWKYSDWSHCKKDCSKGNVQKRSATCITPYGYNATEELCKTPPDLYRSCFECTTETSPCNCGGFKKHTKICKIRDNNHQCSEDVKSFRCEPPPTCSLHSTTHRTESRRKSLPRQCSHIRKSKTDGNYIVYVKGKPVQVYCHNMNSKYPKEYITVNETHNYSLFSDRCTSLQDWQAVKHNSGQTNFRKIRINLQQMQLIANDFSFASTYGNAQLLASAGDCYHNNPECPRGEFSVDLSGTGFKIKQNNNWTTYGNNATMDFHKKHIDSYLSVRGFCGGYCGGCNTSNTKLNVILDDEF